MNDLIKPLIIEDQDYCVNCKSTRTIELYNMYDKPMRYTNLLKFSKDIDIDSILDKYSLSYMKCKKCGKKYKIYWDNHNNIPRPINSSIYYSIFLSNYCNN